MRLQILLKTKMKMKTNSRIGKQLTLADLNKQTTKCVCNHESAGSRTDNNTCHYKKPILPEEALKAFFGIA